MLKTTIKEYTPLILTFVYIYTVYSEKWYLFSYLLPLIIIYTTIVYFKKEWRPFYEKRKKRKKKH